MRTRCVVRLLGACALTAAALMPPNAMGPSARALTNRPAARATGGVSDRLAEQVVALVNQRRVRAGCGPLVVNPRLEAAARGHSADMAARDYFGHDTPDGTTMVQRVTATGYRWRLVGENIFRGARTPAAAVTGWMHSHMHRANILDCRFTQTGVGVDLSADGPWWTEDFGRPR